MEKQGKRGRWKAITVSENTREIIKSFETRRLRTCSWRRKGDNSREREKRRKIDLFKQPLKVMSHIITRAYESRLACQTLISNWIDRCFGQHSWNSVHSLLRDNPRIPTNPLSGSRQPPLLWGPWIRTKPCSKLTRPLQPWLIQTEVIFQLDRIWMGFLLTV